MFNFLNEITGKYNSSVALIIATKEEELNLRNCLESINAQTYHNIRIIVVDAYSKDKTVNIAKEYTSEVHIVGGGLARQRNHGINIAQDSTYILFVDADMLLAPELIQACVAKLENNKNIAGLFIDEVILGKNYFSSVRRFERSFYSGTTIDAGRFYRTQAVISVNGFDETPNVVNSVEDWDFDQKIRSYGDLCLLDRQHSRLIDKEWGQRGFVIQKGASGKYTDFVIYHNESEFSLFKYLHKKSFYAASFDVYIEKWGSNNYHVNQQFSFLYRYFFVFLEHGKWKKFITGAYFIPGLYFLRICVGVVFCFRNIFYAKNRPCR